LPDGAADAAHVAAVARRARQIAGGATDESVMMRRMVTRNITARLVVASSFAAWVGLAVGLAGCGDSASCDKVGKHLAGLLDDGDVPEGMDQEAIAAMTTETCKAKKWSTDVRKCLVAAKSEDDVEPCMREQTRAAADYVDRARTSEAKQELEQIAAGARTYYMDPPQPGLDPVAPQFPGPSAGPTPPLGACCEQGGKCEPQAAQWETEVWTALQFSVDDPHYYSYQYIVDGDEFTARAIGDLDCDGTYATFEKFGAVDAALGEPRVMGGIKEVRPLE
jgi:hypothetical protein